MKNRQFNLFTKNDKAVPAPASNTALVKSEDDKERERNMFNFNEKPKTSMPVETSTDKALIKDTEIDIKTYKGQRVVTFKDIDKVHHRPEGTARKRFNDNKKHFVEGEDYYKISPSEFRTAIGYMDERQQNDITLFTESGYLMLVKSFTDDLAWTVQRELVKSYFRLKTISSVTDSYMIADPIERAKKWIEEEQERQQLKKTVAIQSDQITEMKPKANYYDIILQSPDLIPISIIAKDYGKSAQWLNDYLWRHKVQYKLHGTWVLYAKYADKGFVGTKTHNYQDNMGTDHSSVTTYWTQSGRRFIYELLKKENMFPLIEK